jgi:hypothetical protein
VFRTLATIQSCRKWRDAVGKARANASRGRAISEGRSGWRPASRLRRDGALVSPLDRQSRETVLRLVARLLNCTLPRQFKVVVDDAEEARNAHYGIFYGDDTLLP